MKTLEVRDKFLRGKQLAWESNKLYKRVLTEFSKYAEEWPENGMVINEWFNSIEVSDISKRTYYHILRSAGTYMFRYYKLTNPADTAEIPRFKKKQRRYFSPEQIMMVLASCKYRYDRELILTLVDSLCRVGGLSSLKGKDILDGFIVTKEKTGERKYRLDIRICNSLRKLAGGEDEYVFKKADGQQVPSGTLTKRVRTIVKRAGITGGKLGSHTFRHSGASLVAKEYRNVMIVQTLLQHDSPETSMGYIHDVDIEIQKDISPLQLVKEKAYNGNGFIEQEYKQITMGEDGEGEETTAVVTLEGEETGRDSFYDDMFPAIPEDVSVRPLLKAEDLMLIRFAFIEMSRIENNHREMLKAREMMKRILRKSNTGGN